MSNILFRKGLYDDFKTNVLGYNTETQQFSNEPMITEGALYFTEDEGGLYLGVSVPNENGEGAHLDVKRIQGSLLYFDTLEEFEENTAPPYDTNVIYFIGDKNTLARYDGTEWKILNSNQEVVAALSTEINKVKEDLTKEENRAQAAEKDLRDAIDDIEENYLTVEAFNVKVNEFSTSLGEKVDNSDFAALGVKVDANTANYNTLSGELAKKFDKAGGTISGNINMSSNKITSLSDGTDNSDAATYGQVKAVDAKVDAANAAAAAVDAKVNSLRNDVLSAIIDENGDLVLTKELDANEQTIYNVVVPDDPDGSEAANVAYVQKSIKANDAMTFCGLVGILSEGAELTDLPTEKVQCGDTYKVATDAEYIIGYDNEGNAKKR